MEKWNDQIVKRHIKTHTEMSALDWAAVTVLNSFLRSKGRIITDFPTGDKWPNLDGSFEYVPDPTISRAPRQKFVTQIKGTTTLSKTEHFFSYQLQSLGFPAAIFSKLTLDPALLFVVVNPEDRGKERVFWKYMSPKVLREIDYQKSSVAIHFTEDDEIENSEKGILAFCQQLNHISNTHSYLSGLSDLDYKKEDIDRIINNCNEEITEFIDLLVSSDYSRDSISKKIIARLRDFCGAAIIKLTSKNSYNKASLKLAWELALLNGDTNYLCSFYDKLRYLDMRVPEEGQAERLILNYYHYLWQIQQDLRPYYGSSILFNLDSFPLDLDPTDSNYYNLIAKAINCATTQRSGFNQTRYSIVKSHPFYVQGDRYYELTLQLVNENATKYNRITVYSCNNIPAYYPIQISYVSSTIKLWDIDNKIIILKDWRVSIEPSSLNMISKIIHANNAPISSRFGEYQSFMDFLKTSGITVLDLIDLEAIDFNSVLNNIFNNTNTSHLKTTLLMLKKRYSKKAPYSKGKNVIRYLLIHLSSETIRCCLPDQYSQRLLDQNIGISSRCYPFEKNPFISNLAGRRTTREQQVSSLIKVAGNIKYKAAYPYIAIRNATENTGEIYHQTDKFPPLNIESFNAHLDSWEQSKGFRIVQEEDMFFIKSYETTTISILKELITLSQKGTKGQHAFNKRFIKDKQYNLSDPLKIAAIENAFVYSQILLIYGAAGTGKTTLLNYLSNLTVGKKKLFLTKTNAALENLKRRITNPGNDDSFVSIDSFTRRYNIEDYDVIFVDECSTIENEVMSKLLEKRSPSSYLVLSGDIHQIESIDFGNWFYYAKEIISTSGASVELLNNWRTNNDNLISLWDSVRKRNHLMIEKLAIDDSFCDVISEKILHPEYKDEVVLCLNYDGKFGLNNINNYFQCANPHTSFKWHEWEYKVDDPILFNNSERFPFLYNNLKGRIRKIEQPSNSEIIFTVTICLILTEKDCDNYGIDFISNTETETTIRFSISDYYDDNGELIEDKQSLSVVPFQLAYAVSIHKAQGLEYDSVKVIIPKSNTEKITHAMFYTAITRAKKSLKIYWSAETMNSVLTGFENARKNDFSLNIIKSKLTNEGLL